MPGEWDIGSPIKNRYPHSRIGKYVWYGEHDNFNMERDGYVNGKFNPGGIASCSTNDFITWKNEGIMMNYVNVTDMIRGSLGPFKLERPKVLFNELTKRYIMWMTINNESGDLGMAGVAVSNFANGPFDFIRSFYPDGNQTRDQTVFQDSNGTAFLVRTYYATVEYILPSPIMQPMWESVKNDDGTTNYPLNYHRAHYEPGYDDYHDIYLQRWRTESKPWKVTCVNVITKVEREVLYGKKYLNFEGEVCNDPFEKKIVHGQGSPLQEISQNGIQSRFLDPSDQMNSIWKPSSVPGVKAQPWSANYKDGTCGMRKMDNDMHEYDPNLPDRELEHRLDCSNIADNPIHPTLPDKLIGPNRIVEKRRAKYVSVSRLTEDFLDTSGILHSFEGEMEDEKDLVNLLNNIGLDFGWDSGKSIKSTLHPPKQNPNFQQEDDWDTRFHQYIKSFNDRALYSMACVLDGNCPVNFKDQVAGHP